MKRFIMLSISLISAQLFATAALAAEASVTIHAPADGATLDVMEQNRVDYEVVPGPGGDHTHAVVDGKETAILRQLKGSYTLESLAPGPHEICIRVVNKNHTPIGVEKCIGVTVQ
jgi:hypothetical protein